MCICIPNGTSTVYIKLCLRFKKLWYQKQNYGNQQKNLQILKFSPNKCQDSETFPLILKQLPLFGFMRNFHVSLIKCRECLGIFKLLRRPGIDSDSLCRLAGRYDNPIPTRFLAPIDCSKIPAQIPNPDPLTYSKHCSTFSAYQSKLVDSADLYPLTVKVNK